MLSTPTPNAPPHTTSTTSTTTTPIIQVETPCLHCQRTFVFVCGLAEGKASAFEPTSCLCPKAAEWEFEFSEPARRTGWSRPLNDTPIFIYLLVKLRRKSSDVQCNHTMDIWATNRNIVITVFPPDQCSTDAKKITKRMKYAAFWKTDWPTAGWSLKLCCYGKKKRVSKTLYIPHSVYKHVKQQLTPDAKQITDQPKLFLFSSLQIQAVTFCLWAPATILPNQADHFYPSCTSSIQAGVSSCCRGKSWMLRPWTLGVLQKYSLIKMTVNVHRHLSPCFRLRRMHIW